MFAALLAKTKRQYCVWPPHGRLAPTLPSPACAVLGQVELRRAFQCLSALTHQQKSAKIFGLPRDCASRKRACMQEGDSDASERTNAMPLESQLRGCILPHDQTEVIFAISSVSTCACACTHACMHVHDMHAHMHETSIHC